MCVLAIVRGEGLCTSGGNFHARNPLQATQLVVDPRENRGCVKKNRKEKEDKERHGGGGRQAVECSKVWQV